MAATDHLLMCLALERRAYALLCRWEMSSCARDPHFDLLGRLADECDRYRHWLRELCLSQRLGIPPQPELRLDSDGAYLTLLTSCLQELIALLPKLESELTGMDRQRVSQIRRAAESQLNTVRDLFSEPSAASQRAPLLQSSAEDRTVSPGG